MKTPRQEALQWWEVARMAEDFVGAPEQALQDIYEHAREVAEFLESMTEEEDDRYLTGSGSAKSPKGVITMTGNE